MREITVVGMIVIGIGTVTTILGVACLISPAYMDGGLVAIFQGEPHSDPMGRAMETGFSFVLSIILGLVFVPIGLLIGGIGIGGLLGGVLGRSAAERAKRSNDDRPVFE